MFRRTPRSTRTDTLFPYTTLFRSQGVGVHREALGRIAPGLLDGGVEQVAAEPAADAVRHEPEVGEVDGAAGAARLVAPVQLEVAGRRSVHMKHEDLDAVVGEDAGELGI